jgi:hypothetical membrane protein
LTCGLIGPIVFSITYLVLGATLPGYDNLRQPISDLELGSYGWMQSLNFIVFGVFSTFFAVGLRMELMRGLGAIWLPTLQVCIAVGLMVSGIFIHNPLHTLGSMVSFLSLILSFFLFARRFEGDNRWKGWSLFSIICGILMIIFLALFGSARDHHGHSGLFERMVVFIRTIWSLPFITRLLIGIRLSPIGS